MKSIELEKTFLLRYVPGLLKDFCRSKTCSGHSGCKFIEISDLYIPLSSIHPVIRIRKIGERMEITKKQPIRGADSSEQSEHTIELSKEEFQALSNLPGKELVKTRYLMDGAEIDVFHGKLEGLVTADFEFKSRQEMEAFKPPVFCLADVTQEKTIAGGMLCGKSYKDVEPVLERHGYKKISLIK